MMSCRTGKDWIGPKVLIKDKNQGLFPHLMARHGDYIAAEMQTWCMSGRRKKERER